MTLESSLNLSLKLTVPAAIRLYSLMDNLEFKTLIKENKTLHNGMRGGVKSLYDSFYAEEYISEDIYKYCKDDEDLMVDRLVTTLRDRVKYDPKAFSVIIRVLRETVSMDKLADMLEERLSTLQIEAQRNKETQDRKKRELEDAQRYSSPIAIYTRSPQRPTELDTTAVCRDVVNTGPAGYGHRHTPIKFQKSGGQASSLGTGVDITSPSSTRNTDFKKWYVCDVVCMYVQSTLWGSMKDTHKLMNAIVMRVCVCVHENISDYVHHVSIIQETQT